MIEIVLVTVGNAPCACIQHMHVYIKSLTHIASK